MRHTFLLVLLTISLGLAGCMQRAYRPMPDALLAVNPATECPDQYAGGWDVRAKLIENDERSYIAVYLGIEYTLTRHPEIDLNTGYAVYKARVGDTYFYDVGKLPDHREIGTFMFESVNASSGWFDRNRYNTIFIRMERQRDTDCLELTELN